MLNALVGIVIIIIIIYIAIVLYQKYLMKTAEKMQTEIKHFANLKLENKVSQLKQMGLVGETLDKVNEAEKTFAEIIDEELPSTVKILDNVKKDAKGLNLLKTRDGVDAAQAKLEKIATSLDEIQAVLTNITKLEKAHRAAVNDLEERYKKLRKILLTRNSEFGPALDALENQLADIEKTFDDFSNLTHQGDHANAEKILIDLNKATITLEKIIDITPDLYQANHVTFNNQLNEISAAYQQMRKNGFAFNDDDFEISLKELRQAVNDNLTALKHLDVQMVKNQDDEITERINGLYDKMEQQIKARKAVDKSLEKVGKFIEHAYHQNQTLSNELEQLSHNYSLEHNEIETTNQLGNKITFISNQYQNYLTEIKAGQAVYTNIAHSLKQFQTDLTEIENQQMALNDSVSEFSAEEKKAHQILHDLNTELHAIQRKIENLNLPGISDDYVDYFGIVSDEINHLSSTMNKVKISMDDVQKQLEQIKNDRDTLQEKTDDLIDQSVLAEQVMQYANRYVGKDDDIDRALAKAKELFDHKFNYADSLAVIANAVDRVEPGSYKKIEDHYYANKSKSTKK